MPHVSRHTPVRKVSDKTFELLVACVTAKGSVAERRAFFTTLLTPTERIMFSKRFAIIYMLAKGHSFDVIQDTLRVSPSTIARIWVAVQKGKYADIVRRVQKRRKNDNEFDLLQWLSDLVPPMSMSKKQYAERMRRLGL